MCIKDGTLRVTRSTGRSGRDLWRAQSGELPHRRLVPADRDSLSVAPECAMDGVWCAGANRVDTTRLAPHAKCLDLVPRCLNALMP